MKYVDTNIFIYAIENHPVYGRACKKILLDIQNEELKACASVLVLVEIVNVLARINRELKKRKQKPLDLEANLEAVLALPFVWFELDFFTIRKATECNYNIAALDYFHLASMEINSIKEIISADKELNKVAFIKRTDPRDY